MKTRTDLLNHLVEKYNLNRYLEIGVQVPALNFDKIICKQKIGVDPDLKSGATYYGDSDTFFRCWEDIRIKDQPGIFDLIFIDGLHTAEQVKKDFVNASSIISDNGFIVLHDCNPQLEEHTIVPRPTKTGHWNGDVYKFAVNIVDKYTVDIDNGCLVWKSTFGSVLRYDDHSWDYFNENRKELLNLITWDEFIKL